GDAYVERLMHWIQSVWDWEAVESIENRAEGIRAATSGAVCYSLDNDDLKGLFGGEYADSPGALPGYLEDPDSWPSLQAHAYIPRGRFSEGVQRELFEEGETTEPSTVADLRRRYNEAVDRGEESFTLDGLDFLTSYAKYVLQYLDMNNIPDSDKLRDRIKPQEER
ncbi:MAG: hypothetical protein J5I35_05320, partial [Methanothrix harundinacea]|nr:hypothetical protein [Methanothrix harundinacea]